MNTTVTVQNRSIWLPLVAAGTALALAVGLLTFVVLQQQTADSSAGRRPATTVAPPEIVQAEWEVVARAGGGKRIPKALEGRAKKRAGEVSGLVQGVLDAVFLDPAAAQDKIKETFARPAAEAIADPGFGLPEGAEQVQTTKRKLVVTVYAGSGSQAVARSVVTAKGIASGREFKVRHKSFLWLVRNEGNWKVVAFEIDQAP